jgi:zinc protease
MATEESFRMTPPDASPVVPDVALSFRVSTLENGLTLAVLERHAVPVVNADLVIARGLADTRAPRDAYDVLAELLGHGTARRDGGALASAYARQGAVGRHWHTLDSMGLGVTAAAQDLEPALGLLAENVTTPRLSAFARARLDMVRGMENTRNDPKSILSRNVARTLFGRAHPHGFAKWPLTHTEALRSEDAAGLYAELFRPSHATLIVVGNTTVAEVERVARRWFGSWAPAPALARSELPPPESEPRVFLVERVGAGQVEIAIAARGPDAEQDFAAFEILVKLLTGTSSRLRGEIRVEMGAGYQFGGSAVAMRGGSFLTIYGVLDAAKAPSAVRAMLAAIEEARTRGVREPDLERARTTILAEWRDAALSNHGAAHLASDAIARGLPLESVASFPRRMATITRDDVNRVAQRYLAEDALHVIVVAEKSAHAKFTDLGLGPVDLRDRWAEPVQP